MTVYLRRSELEGRDFYFSLCQDPKTTMLNHPETHAGYIGDDGSVVKLHPAYFATEESAMKFARAYLPADVEIIKQLS